MDISVQTSKPLKGDLSIPGDKSISHRAVMIGSISKGTTEIVGFLHAADPMSTLSCFGALGISHSFQDNKLLIHGKGIHGLQQSALPLEAGNSGTTMRLLSGILSGQHFSSTVTGDKYLSRRPMKRIIDPLTKMGARISATEKFTAPLTIHPVNNLEAIDYELPIASAQIKSAILFAGIYAQGTTRIREHKPSRDHTERMLQVPTEHRDGTTVISIEGGKTFSASNFVVPGDPSSAAFFLVAALIVPQSEIRIVGVGLNPTRIGFLAVLKQMGAEFSIEHEQTVSGEPIGDIIVRSSILKTNIELSGDLIPNIIDEIPILSIAAAFGSGTFTVRDAQDLRNKETDRISALCANLRKMGLDVDEFADGFAFESKNIVFGSTFDSFDDHRIAMAFGIAALSLKGESIIRNAECVSISYPTFWETIQSLQR